MEIALTPRDDSSVDVYCDTLFSHTFDRKSLPPPEDSHAPPERPAAYGQMLYSALFPDPSVAMEQLGRLALGERIVLTADDAHLQSIPWEYLHDAAAYLVEDFHFVRGIPGQKRSARTEARRGLYIVAVPSSPLDSSIAHLNIEGEWLRLRENVEKLDRQVVLERVTPATLEALRGAVATKKDLIIHFMGHGAQGSDESLLVFEKDSGAIDLVTARDFVRRIRGTAFLVTLNACVTATPGATEFANLAGALVKHGIPYALGMRFPITDEDARTFSRVVYRELGGGASVEEAVLQGRLELRKSSQAWAVGVPVLYTSLSEAAPSETVSHGKPILVTSEVRTNFVAIPRAARFQGRTDLLVQIGERLTDDSRPKIFTIHGVGGQGKSALAREVAERFAHAYAGGAYALSLENLPRLREFVVNVAGFLGIDTSAPAEYRQIEQQLLARLQTQRVLLILDNAETLINAVEARLDAALELVDFLKRKLAGTPTTLLVTSRELLGWPGEEYVTLGGLNEVEGSLLFVHHVSMRLTALDLALVHRICRQVDGHPLSLQLLAGAFDNSSASLEEFVVEYEQQLAQSFDRYKSEQDRHYSLHSSIDTSLRYLTPELRATLQQLTIFATYFLPGPAAEILGPPSDGQQNGHAPVANQLHQLWKRSLLLRVERTFPDKEVTLYRLLPVVRLYLRSYERQDAEAVGKRFAEVYRDLTPQLNLESPSDIFIIRNMLEDLEGCKRFLAPEDTVTHNLALGFRLMRLGFSDLAVSLMEEGLEIAQNLGNQKLYISALEDLTLYYGFIGDRVNMVQLSEQLLEKVKHSKDQGAYLRILNGMVFAYKQVGLVNQAIQYAETALAIARELQDESSEASVLEKLGVIYREDDKYKQAEAAYLRAKEIYEKKPFSVDTFGVLINLSTVYLYTDRSKVIELRLEALELAKKAGKTRLEAEAFYGLGVFYAQQGDFKQGLEHLDRAIAIFHTVSEIRSECNALEFKARVYREMGQFDQAIEMYEQLLSLTEQANLIGLYTAYAHNLGNVYSRSGRPEQATLWYRTSYQKAIFTGNTIYEAMAAYKLATLEIDNGNREHAVRLAERVVEIMELENLSKLPDQEITRDHAEKMVEWCRQGTMLNETVSTMVRIAGVLGGQALGILVRGFFNGEGKFQVDTEFMTAIARLLDGEEAAIPPENPHSQAFHQIKEQLQPRRQISQEGREAVVQRTLAALRAPRAQRGAWLEQVVQLRSQFDRASEEDERAYLAAILAMLEEQEPALAASNVYHDDYETINNDRQWNERVERAFERFQQVRSRDEMGAAASEHPIMTEEGFIQLVDNAIKEQIPDHLQGAFNLRLFWVRQIRIQQLKHALAGAPSGDEGEAASLLLALAMEMANLRVPHMAIAYFEQALTGFHDEDARSRGIISLNIGSMYHGALRYQQALQHYYQARELFTAAASDDLVAQVASRIKAIEEA